MAHLVGDRGEAARALLRDNLGPEDRLLVLGAGGWFGTALRSLLSADLDIPVLAVASGERVDHICGRDWQLVGWEAAHLAEFAPTVVANFAFLTRERIALDGEVVFRATNEMLLSQFEFAANLPSVRAVVTASSGAAVTEPELPYGEMKREEERIAHRAQHANRAAIVARAYSVSGPFVRRPDAYAFSNFARQAMTGSIKVQAQGAVYRRYVDVRDFIAVCLSQALRGVSGTIDSGGELIELGRLAEKFANAVEPAALVDREFGEGVVATSYASDDVTWSAACADLGFVPLTLDEQVQQAVDNLLRA